MDLLGNDISIDDIINAPADDSISLDDILAEYGAPSGPAPESVSRPIRLDFGADGTGSAGAYSPAADLTAGLPGDYFPPQPTPSASRFAGQAPQDTPPSFTGEEDDDVRIYTPPKAAEPDDSDVRIYSIDDIISQADRLSARWVRPARSPRAEYAPQETTEPQPELDEEGYEQPLPPEPAEDTEEEKNEREGRHYRTASRPVPSDLKTAVMAPILSLMALLTMRRHKPLGFSGDRDEEEEEEELGPEMPAGDASRYYASHVRSAKFRFRLSLFMTVVLLWISFGLPVGGALNSRSVASLVCLILLMTVAMLGLDIFTAGVMSLVRGRPGLWTLVSLSCLASGLDAAVCASTGKVPGLPLCAVSAASMTFAIWGSLLTCRGNKLSLRALDLSGEPYVVTSEPDVGSYGSAVLKSRRSTEGYLRRCEEPDCAEAVFEKLAPYLLMAAVTLAVIAAAVSGNWNGFFRIFAAILCPCAPMAAYVAFPLPFLLVSQRIFRKGTAIAGWAGASDIGRARRLIVTDKDLFPKGTVSFDSRSPIRILDRCQPGKAISVAGSMICASGSELAPLFMDLMRKNNCDMLRVEDFSCHEGGGLTALIDGETVLCGNAGFMRLMSIRLPQKLAARSSVFLSINGVLTAIFNITFDPIVTVRDGLQDLLRGRRSPIFAVRDFLITPAMLGQKFDMRFEAMEFPSYADRFRLSATESGEHVPVSAIICKEGLQPLSDLYECGRRVYSTARFLSMLSVVWAIGGAAVMFYLCITGAMATVTVGNLLLYSLLGVLPAIVDGFIINR